MGGQTVMAGRVITAGAGILTVAQVRERLGLRSNKAARAVMREIEHRERGRELWTTEAALARWMAAGTQAMREPLPLQDMDPLEAVAKRLALQMVGELLPRWHGAAA